MNRQIAIGGSLLLTVPAVNASGTHIQEAEIQSVIESEDWETIKTIWRMADRAKPPGNMFGDSYQLAMEKGDSLRAVVDSLFLETEFDNPELRQAVYLIQRITSMRIMRLSRINPSMLMRMMPPWTETVQDNLLFNFEQRITTLSDLVESGEITAVEFAAARDTLMERAETWAMLEILQEVRTYRNYDFDGWQPEIVDADLVLERLDMSYRAALDTLSKAKLSVNAESFQVVVDQHRQFTERYDEFVEAKPVFRILLMDLIDPETMQ